VHTAFHFMNNCDNESSVGRLFNLAFGGVGYALLFVLIPFLEM